MPRRRRRVPRLAWLVAAGGVAALVAAIVIAAQRSQDSPPTRAEVERYQSAIKGPLDHWGKIEDLGMRPAVADLQSGNGVPPPLIAGEARAWQSGLKQIRQQMHDAGAPAPLGHAADLFDQSLQLYLRAAEVFEQAAAGPQSDAPPLIRAGVQKAQQGDCIFDDAALEVQKVRRSVGLGTDSGLPNAPCQT
jgi:hypothetical protein